MGVFDRLSGITGGDSEAEAEASDEEETTPDPNDPATMEPADFRDRAEDLAGRSNVPTLDFTVESLAKLDGLVAGASSPVDDPAVYGSYLGEVFVRDLEGSWVRDSGDWAVAVDLGDDDTTVAVFGAAEMAMEKGPVFQDVAAKLEADGATRIDGEPPAHREVDAAATPATPADDGDAGTVDTETDDADDESTEAETTSESEPAVEEPEADDGGLLASGDVDEDETDDAAADDELADADEVEEPGGAEEAAEVDEPDEDGDAEPDADDPEIDESEDDEPDIEDADADEADESEGDEGTREEVDDAEPDEEPEGDDEREADEIADEPDEEPDFVKDDDEDDETATADESDADTPEEDSDPAADKPELDVTIDEIEVDDEDSALDSEVETPEEPGAADGAESLADVTADDEPAEEEDDEDDVATAAVEPSAPDATGVEAGDGDADDEDADDEDGDDTDADDEDDELDEPAAEPDAIEPADDEADDTEADELETEPADEPDEADAADEEDDEGGLGVASRIADLAESGGDQETASAEADEPAEEPAAAETDDSEGTRDAEPDATASEEAEGDEGETDDAEMDEPAGDADGETEDDEDVALSPLETIESDLDSDTPAPTSDGEPAATDVGETSTDEPPTDVDVSTADDEPAGEVDDIDAATVDAEEDGTEPAAGDDGTLDDLAAEESEPDLPPRPELKRAARDFAEDWSDRGFDFTPESLARLDAFLDGQWAGRFRPGTLAEASPHPRQGLTPFARVGSYFGQMLVEHLDGEWVPTENGEGAVEMTGRRGRSVEVPVFDVARTCMTAESTFAYRFDALANRFDVDAEAREADDVFDVGGERADSTAVIPAILDRAEAFIEDWPEAGLDYEPASLARLDDLVGTEFAVTHLSNARLGDTTDADSLRFTERVTSAAAYYAAVLVSHLDANWQLEGDVRLVVEGPDGSRTVDPVTVAVGCIRGDDTFAGHFDRLADRVGREPATAD